MSYSLKFCQLCTNHFLGMVSTPCRDPQQHRKDSNVYLMKPQQAMPVGYVTALSMHGRERRRKDSKVYLMKPQHAMGCVTAFSTPGGERHKKKCSAVFFEKAGSAIISQRNGGTVSKAMLLKPLRSGVECI